MEDNVFLQFLHKADTSLWIERDFLETIVCILAAQSNTTCRSLARVAS